MWIVQRRARGGTQCDAWVHRMVISRVVDKLVHLLYVCMYVCTHPNRYVCIEHSVAAWAFATPTYAAILPAHDQQVAIVSRAHGEIWSIALQLQQ